jgi:hypothetical protein
MVAVTDSRFTITPDRRAFMYQTAFLAVKFCMHMILHQFLGFAPFAFHHHHNIKNDIMSKEIYKIEDGLLLSCLKEAKT